MIYEPIDRGSPELETYVTDLKKIGNHAVETVETVSNWRSKFGTKKPGTVNKRDCNNNCFLDSVKKINFFQKCHAA